ncbi:MAG: cytochrome b N-terminal domain-containing protein [Armatimonadetes bacterium]|nr:cytochrome b N-terminal domain-containing protein [Armatimonadota bacterium]
MRTILHWIDEQTGMVTLIRRFMEEPLAQGVGYPHVFGSLALFMFIVQMLTGILLMTYYSPSPDHAYDTVQFITYKLPFGAFVRGLHHWTATGMMVAVGLHLLQVFLWGAYKKPRQIIWVLGVLLLMVTLGFSFTGYLLPWDQKAYWATVVGTNIAGSIPWFGDAVRGLLRGGATVGAITLTRFFAIHVAILPLLIMGLITFHVFQVRKKGITPPGHDVDQEDGVRYTQYFWPHQLLKDAVVALGALLLLSVVALKFGAPIEPVANPADTAYVPRPEWYFLWLFELLKYFPGSLEFVGAVLLPTVGIVLLAVYPYLDRNPARSLSRRRYSATLCVATFAFVSWLGVRAIITSPKPQELTPLQQQGLKVFMDQRCTSCHGVNSGGGNAGPDLAQAGGHWKKDYLVALLRNPSAFQKRSIMPATDLSAEKMNALVAYLMVVGPRSTLPDEPPVGPKKPATHFQESWYINHKFEVRKDPSQCKSCHESEFCRTCHQNRKPDSHLGNWLKFHFGTAKEKPEYCQVCHDKKFCDDCHSKLLHTQDWLTSKHRVAGVNNSETCLKCHKRVFCDACHRGAKPSSHVATWRRTHGKVGAGNSQTCSVCHGKDACAACHGMNMPHPARWSKTHGHTAKKNMNVCSRCHESDSCTSCHGLQMPHPPDWTIAHRQTALAKSRLCANCHGEGKRDTCKKCHTTAPPFHDATWKKKHPDMGKQNQILCELCHGKNSCMDCHKTPMPHASDWMMTHKSHGASFKKGAFCFKCHQKEYCAKCHDMSNLPK